MAEMVDGGVTDGTQTLPLLTPMSCPQPSIMGFFPERIDTILNRTEQTWRVFPPEEPPT